MALHYPVPWRQVLGIWRGVATARRASQEAFSAGIVARMRPAPQIEGLELLPSSPRFVLTANHYQRKGMWIAHPASAITQAVASRFGHEDPVVHWIVTANWPRWGIGKWRFRSPGDWLLPRVAHALWCFPVAAAGADPQYSAGSLRRMLRALPGLKRPLGLFPEGLAGSAAGFSPPLPGVGRLMRMLAGQGWAFLPVGILETTRLVIRFGPLLTPEELLERERPAEYVMERIRRLAAG